MKREIFGDLVISMESSDYTKRIWCEKITEDNNSHHYEVKTAIEYKGKSQSLNNLDIPDKKN